MNYPTETQRQLDAEVLRREQAEEGRRLAQQEQRRVIGLPAGTRDTLRAVVATGPTQKEAPKSKGHEAFLKALQGSGADIVVEMISSARTYYGKLRHSDKFTLTVNVTGVRYDGDTTIRPIAEAYDRVLFKHDISEFYTTTAAPAGSRAAGARA